MESTLVGLLGIVVLLILVFMSFHVAICMGVVGVVGAYFILGFNPALVLLNRVPFSTSCSFDFAVIPLFMVMGLVVYQGGLVGDIYEFLHRTLARARGGLMIATMIAAGFFGACSGSSIAAAVTFSKISVPEMIKRKYHRGFACGGVAAVGTQSALIPPSGLLIIYAIVTEQSVGKMLMAGFLPGILSNLLYCVAVFLVARVRPEWVPGGGKGYTWAESKKYMTWVWPLPLLMLLVLGMIYFGVCTPSEAAALGASLAIVICTAVTLFKGYAAGEKLSVWGAVRRINLGAAFTSATSSSAMIFFILIGAFIFGRFIALSGVPVLISETISGLDVNRWVVYLGFVLVWLVLGTFMSATAIIVIIMPVILPALEVLGFNIIWFGIIAAKLSEIAMITPPVGMNLYAVKGAVGDTASFGEIVYGTLAFLATDIVTLFLLTVFPIISLLLPQAM